MGMSEVAVQLAREIEAVRMASPPEFAVGTEQFLAIADAFLRQLERAIAGQAVPPKPPPSADTAWYPPSTATEAEAAAHLERIKRLVCFVGATSKLAWALVPEQRGRPLTDWSARVFRVGFRSITLPIEAAFPKLTVGAEREFHPVHDEVARLAKSQS